MDPRVIQSLPLPGLPFLDRSELALLVSGPRTDFCRALFFDRARRRVSPAFQGQHRLPELPLRGRQPRLCASDFFRILAFDKSDSLCSPSPQRRHIASVLVLDRGLELAFLFPEGIPVYGFAPLFRHATTFGSRLSRSASRRFSRRAFRSFASWSCARSCATWSSSTSWLLLLSPPAKRFLGGSWAATHSALPRSILEIFS